MELPFNIDNVINYGAHLNDPDMPATCEGCRLEGHAEMFQIDPTATTPTPYCGTCTQNLLRQANEIAEQGADPADFPWDSEFGNQVRHERNQRLDSYRWTVAPDSPLTALNQAEFMDALKWLHTLTTNYETPYMAKLAMDTMTWPEYNYGLL